jgi:hypothetical protein
MKNLSHLVPYYLRPDLTADEIKAVGAYQYLYPNNIQKMDWSFEIPSHWKSKSWCYAINSYCRFPEFQSVPAADEIHLIKEKINYIDSAVSKSHIPKSDFIFKGFYDIDWLFPNRPGSNYTDKAFGSFSFHMDQALAYTNSKKPILFQLFLKPEMSGLFLDFTEYEVLRPRHSSYIIIDIFVQNVKTENINTDAIIYLIEERNQHK